MNLTNIDAAALALGVGILIFMLAESARNAPKGDTSIDPTTGGVKIPTPQVYGPPAPLGADDQSFVGPPAPTTN